MNFERKKILLFCPKEQSVAHLRSILTSEYPRLNFQMFASSLQREFMGFSKAICQYFSSALTMHHCQAADLCGTSDFVNMDKPKCFQI